LPYFAGGPEQKPVYWQYSFSQEGFQNRFDNMNNAANFSIMHNLFRRYVFFHKRNLKGLPRYINTDFIAKFKTISNCLGKAINLYRMTADFMSFHSGLPCFRSKTVELNRWVLDSICMSSLRDSNINTTGYLICCLMKCKRRKKAYNAPGSLKRCDYQIRVRIGSIIFDAIKAPGNLFNFLLLFKGNKRIRVKSFLYDSRKACHPALIFYKTHEFICS